MNDMTPDAVAVAPSTTTPAPVKRLNPEVVQSLGQTMAKNFVDYKSQRNHLEQKWLRNLRQYLGIYDTEILSKIPANRSRAYPRITRVKVISVVSRVMNLMFPGNERNWQLTASPSPEMDPSEIMQAIQARGKADGENGVQRQVDAELVEAAVKDWSEMQAKKLSVMIDDQLQEIGGDQTMDHIALCRKVVQSGTTYGVGILLGPFARETRSVQVNFVNGQMAINEVVGYKPMMEFVRCWDFYPDMSATSIWNMDGFFVRKVMTKSQLRQLANRPDFMEKQIKNYIMQKPKGDYSGYSFETELRAMGTKLGSSELNISNDTGKYEVMVFYGPISGRTLIDCGADVPEGKESDDVEAEIWLVGDHVIKVDVNPWRKLGVNMRMAHAFVFDEDDTGPIGNGLPDVVRDSQMSICAATRMLLDNAGVVCGPNLEVNTSLLLAGQDVGGTEAYKVWQRDDTDPSMAGVPAVRNIAIDSHLPELTAVIKLFMDFADAETFVGPLTGGDMERKGTSEPMRTAAGASMLRSDAALPFKDIIRNFDTFTQSVLQALVTFNKKFNPEKTPQGDFNVIARGATSLIAKEVRGMQLDQLAVTLTPEDRMHIDDRKFLEARFASRDMENMLVSETEAKSRKEAASASAQQQAQLVEEQVRAEIRKTLADAFKAITQGQKNAAAADAATVTAALDVLAQGVEHELAANAQTGTAGSAQSQ